MAVAFWSVKLTTQGPVNVQPPEGYVLNVQQVALIGGKEKSSYKVKAETQAIEGGDLESFLGTLKANTCDQFSCSLVFGYDVATKFSLVSDDKEGKAAVYLSGKKHWSNV